VRPQAESRRSRAIEHKLRSVEELPSDHDAAARLGFSQANAPDGDEEETAGKTS